MLLNKPNFSNRFYYHAHGITFDSSIELEELTPISASELGELPVTLNIGKTPKKLKTIIAKGERFQLSENEFLLPIDQIATFWVKNGNSITIEMESNVSFNQVKPYLYASAMGALAHQRKLFPFHASAIKINGKAYLFCGESGVGKSTLAGYFNKLSYTVLSDDISIVKSDGSNFEVEYGFNIIKLTENSINALELGPVQKFFQEEYETKFAVKTTLPQKPTTEVLGGIFILQKANKSSFSISEVKGWLKFSQLINHCTFRQKFINPMGLEKAQFDFLNLIFHHIPIYHINRPMQEGIVSTLEQFEKELILKLSPR